LILLGQDEADDLPGLDLLRLVPEAPVAQVSAGGVLFGNRRGLVVNGLKTLDPAGAVGGPQIDPAGLHPGFEDLRVDRFVAGVSGKDGSNAADQLSRIQQDGDTHGHRLIGQSRSLPH
jgi:hypothetical protein